MVAYLSKPWCLPFPFLTVDSKFGRFCSRVPLSSLHSCDLPSEYHVGIVESPEPAEKDSTAGQPHGYAALCIKKKGISMDLDNHDR